MLESRCGRLLGVGGFVFSANGSGTWGPDRWDSVLALVEAGPGCRYLVVLLVRRLLWSMGRGLVDYGLMRSISGLPTKLDTKQYTTPPQLVPVSTSNALSSATS